MKELQKLSARQATLITINVMFGTGVFINTVNLARTAGFLGFASYIAVALLLLPLIISISTLTKLIPLGGFYAYAKEPLGSWWGFISAWAYFTGKLASASLLIHVFSLLSQTIITPLAAIPALYIDIAVLTLFVWLNHYGLQTGARLSYVFIALKCTPIATAIIASIALINHWAIPSYTLQWPGVPHTFAIVLYAFFGFEVACSMSLAIKDTQQYASRIIFQAFFITVSITVVYQLLTFLAIGPELMKSFSYLNIFPLFFNYFLPPGSLLTKMILLVLHICGSLAALGGSYGIIMSNAWNLYVLAHNNHLPFSKYLTKKNTYGIPFYCIIAEGIICATYLLATLADQVGLQEISVIGCTTAFLLSIIALMKLEKTLYHRISYITLLSFASCMIFYSICLEELITDRLYFLVMYGIYMLLGISAYSFMKILSTKTHQK